MQFHLNIGLARNDGKPDNTILHTVAAMNRFGFSIVHADVQPSNTESTLCAAVHYGGRAVVPALNALAVELAQDCIAHAQIEWTGRVTGQLVGPNADKWGAFDPSFFLLPHHREAA